MVGVAALTLTERVCVAVVEDGETEVVAGAFLLRTRRPGLAVRGARGFAGRPGRVTLLVTGGREDGACASAEAARRDVMVLGPLELMTEVVRCLTVVFVVLGARALLGRDNAGMSPM
jgi:hypothetical protein